MNKTIIALAIATAGAVAVPAAFAQSAPNQTTPPAQTTPAQTAPTQQTTPNQTLPAQGTQTQTPPAQTTPSQTAPAQSTPTQAPPDQTTSYQSTSSTSMMSPDDSGAFVKGQIGRTHMDHHWYSGHDTGYQLTGGYLWAVNPWILVGVEGGYNDLGNIKASNVFHSEDIYNTGRAKLRGWMAGANAHFNLATNWFVTAHAGLYFWKGHGMGKQEDALHRSLSKTSWYAGAGVGYDFSNDFSISVNYDYYKAKKHDVSLTQDMISVGGEYRF
jgi:OOP family OmpA-OmpF porin/outer membrane immunogenic protein